MVGPAEPPDPWDCPFRHKIVHPAAQREDAAPTPGDQGNKSSWRETPVLSSTSWWWPHEGCKLVSHQHLLTAKYNGKHFRATMPTAS